MHRRPNTCVYVCMCIFVGVGASKVRFYVLGCNFSFSQLKKKNLMMFWWQVLPLHYIISWPCWLGILRSGTRSDFNQKSNRSLSESATRRGGEQTWIRSNFYPPPSGTCYAGPGPSYGQAEPRIHGGSHAHGGTLSGMFEKQGSHWNARQESACQIYIQSRCLQTPV